MQNHFFRIAAIYILATAVFYASTRLGAAGALDPTWTSVAWVLAVGSFSVVLGAMWLLYKAVPLPGMLCCAMSVTVLGLAAALDVGAFDGMIGTLAAKELTVHVFMVGVVLLLATIVLMPSRVIAYFTEVVLPALLGKDKDRR